MVKFIKAITSLVIIALTLIVFLDLEKSTDLYYYLNITPSKRILNSTGELVLSQNNIFGFQKRWFMLPLSSGEFLAKITYLLLLVSASHLIFINSVTNYFGVKRFSVSLILLFFNYYFFVNGLHLVRQVVAINLCFASFFVLKNSYKWSLIFTALMFHEIVLILIPLMFIYTRISLLLKVTLLLLIFTLIMDGVRSDRLYILFVYSLYIYTAVSLRKFSIFNVH